MKTFFQLREEQQQRLNEQDLTMVTHDGEEHHVIKGMKHTKANGDKVRHAVGKAAAKLAGVSHANMDNDYSHYTHHEPADTPGAAGKTVTHKSMAHYVKHHAKNDAETYTSPEQHAMQG